jgi:enoyl-CoA hydratase/carnithine racemase
MRRRVRASLDELLPHNSFGRSISLTLDFREWYGTSVSFEPTRVTIASDGDVTHLRLDRAAKRNALDDAMVAELQRFFANPGAVRAVVLDGAGDHFCAGLDLAEHATRTARDVAAHSAGWHVAFDTIQFGKVPVVAVIRGACVGGGFELAAAAHVRVAERSAFFALPEGQRGIFLGGGGSVRLTRLIGTSRVLEMMLTGRRYPADEGERIGAVHYVVDDGAGFAFGMELARKIALNAAHSNVAILQALPRIADMSHAEGLFAETMTASLMATEDESRERINAFLERKR